LPCPARRPPIPPLFPCTTLFRSRDCRQPKGARTDLRGAAGSCTPLGESVAVAVGDNARIEGEAARHQEPVVCRGAADYPLVSPADRKSTRLNSSSLVSSYAGFCS